MTYGQCKEVIRDCCTGKGVNDIRAANREIQRHLDVVSIDKREDQFSTVVWYSFVADGEIYTYGWDFWNMEPYKKEADE